MNLPALPHNSLTLSSLRGDKGAPARPGYGFETIVADTAVAS